MYKKKSGLKWSQKLNFQILEIWKKAAKKTYFGTFTSLTFFMVTFSILNVVGIMVGNNLDKTH